MLKWQQIYIYQQFNLKNKKNKDRIMDTESILMVVGWGGAWRND